MGKVLIIYHSQSGNTKAAADVVCEAAKGISETEVVFKEALDANADDLLACDAIAVGTPDYFSYMAGGIKDFFDRTFYPTQGSVTGKPCGIFLTHGGGGRAMDSVKNICGSFKFRVLDPPISVLNSPDEEATAALTQLGELLANAAKEPKDPDSAS
jgi:flavorubredoxin